MVYLLNLYIKVGYKVFKELNDDLHKNFAKGVRIMIDASSDRTRTLEVAASEDYYRPDVKFLTGDIRLAPHVRLTKVRQKQRGSASEQILEPAISMNEVEKLATFSPFQ